MALARVKTWTSEILTAADLNAEFDNILDNALSLVSPVTGTLDLNGNQLTLDADGDTHITADSDDRIDISVAGTDAVLIGHDTTNTGSFILVDPAAFTSQANTDVARMKIGATNALTVPAGTTAIAAGVHIAEPNFTATGTITSAVSLYIAGAPTEGGTNNYALWVDDGAVQLDGNATVGGTLDVTGATTLSSTLTVTGVVDIASNIVHTGDTNNLIAFTTDAQSFETGGTSRLDLNDSGVRMGAANSRVTTILDEDDMSSDSATALATQQSIKAYVDANSGLVPIERKTSSAVASYDFTTGISSTYRTYVLKGWLLPVTDDVQLWLRVDSNSGASFDAGASDYSWGGAGRASGTAIAGGSTGDTKIATPDAGANFSVGNGAAEGISFTIEINRPSDATYYTSISAFANWHTASTTSVGGVVYGGMRLSAQADDAVQLLFESGNISAGDVTLYGVLNA